MTNLNVKMLIDEKGDRFVPYTSTKALYDPDGETIDSKIAAKLEVPSIIAGNGISLIPDTTNHTVTINCSVPGAVLINNLTTTSSAQGALDAYQGYVLKNTVDSLPAILSGTTDPASSLGENGDIYIKVAS